MGDNNNNNNDNDNNDEVKSAMKKNNDAAKKNNNKKTRLAIVITGCDSGFGKDLAIMLLEESKRRDGYLVVFCGCLLEESKAQFQCYNGDNKNLAIPISMDVTKDSQVQDAAKIVSNWLLDKNSEQKENRHMLALVNNAGIGIPGFIDWLDVSDFQKVFEVNYFGVIRCVKAFQPILKGQATALVDVDKIILQQQDKKNTDGDDNPILFNPYKYYPDGRIINVLSIAGIFAPGCIGTAYGNSKFALDSFTNNLRFEMSMFHVKVIGIYPGFYNTGMLQSQSKTCKFMIDNKLPESKLREYGKPFLSSIIKLMENSPSGFDPIVVVNAIRNTIMEKNPQIKKFVGLDAKYVFYFISKLPVEYSYGIINKLLVADMDCNVPKIVSDKEKMEREKQKQQQEEEKSSSQDKKIN